MVFRRKMGRIGGFLRFSRFSRFSGDWVQNRPIGSKNGQNCAQNSEIRPISDLGSIFAENGIFRSKWPIFGDWIHFHGARGARGARVLGISLGNWGGFVGWCTGGARWCTGGARPMGQNGPKRGFFV